MIDASSNVTPSYAATVTGPSTVDPNAASRQTQQPQRAPPTTGVNRGNGIGHETTGKVDGPDRGTARGGDRDNLEKSGTRRLAHGIRDVLDRGAQQRTAPNVVVAAGPQIRNPSTPLASAIAAKDAPADSGARSRTFRDGNVANLRALQGVLGLPQDGMWTPRVAAAFKDFQQTRGITSGKMCDATRRALKQYAQERGVNPDTGDPV